MGRDFSNAVAKIREAHADSKEILRKWRDLLESDVPVVMKLKDSTGIPYEITMPSIKAAIDRYLANTFSTLKLTSNYGDVSFRLNNDGTVVVEDSNGNLADILADRVITNSISPSNGTLNIIGTVSVNSCNLNSCEISTASISNANIKSANFAGTTTISGNTTITGNVSGLTGSASSLTTNFLSVGKQTVNWVRTGEITNDYETHIDANGNYTGSAQELEAMRFASAIDVVNYCDCMKCPPPRTDGVIPPSCKVYWGPGEVEVTLAPAYKQLRHVATWPLKHYAGSIGSVKMIWDGLGNIQGRILYIRNGAGFTAVPSCVEVKTVLGVTTVTVTNMTTLPPYTCSRFMARLEYDTASTITSHILYRM